MEFDLRQAVRQIVCEPFTTAVMNLLTHGGTSIADPIIDQSESVLSLSLS